MRRFSVLTCAVLLACLIQVRAEGPDDLYIQMYQLIQQAEQLQGTGQNDAAITRLEEAQAGLKSLKTTYPNWNEKVIQFRLGYIQDKLSILKKAKAPSAPAARTNLSVTATLPATIGASTNAAASEFGALKETIARLENDKAVLDARLKEALAAQPAAVDPRELAKAEERVKALEKEKELLRISLDQAEKKSADAAGLAQAKAALAEANAKAALQAESFTKLTEDNKRLEAKLREKSTQSTGVEALRTENENLKKQVATLQSRPATVAPAVTVPTPEVRTQPTEVAALQTAVKRLEAEKQDWEKERITLEAKIAKNPATTPKTTAKESNKIKELERQNETLQKKLAVANNQLFDSKSRTHTLQYEQMTNQLAVLRARLEVFEARKSPFTPEEQALLKASTDTLRTNSTKTATAKKAPREVPAGASMLVAEAQRAFVARRLPEAEQKYKEVLKLDENNTYTLGNLAVIQVEQGRLEDAEYNLKRALEIEPQDAFSLAHLGMIKYRQDKYDEALDYLSRAVQNDSTNPEAHNYLGVVLGQKGQRTPAEAAFRKALELAPGYGDAHHNLAVIYGTQKPAYLELARWHYQKALSGGYKRDQDLEKILEMASAPESK